MKINPSPRRLLLACAGLLLQACTMTSALPPIEPIPVPEMAPLPGDAPSRPLILDRVVIEVPRGTVVGELRKGAFCLFPEPFQWNSDTLVVREGDYHREFERVLREYNYRLPNKPASLFEIPTTGEEFVIAAKITNVRQNHCSMPDLTGRSPGLRKGEIRFAIRWEVFSLEDQKVVFVFDNEGYGVLKEFRTVHEAGYSTAAFGNALRELLQNEDFRKLATSLPKFKEGLQRKTGI